jgi:hypothetical protein
MYYLTEPQGFGELTAYLGDVPLKVASGTRNQWIAIPGEPLRQWVTVAVAVTHLRAAQWVSVGSLTHICSTPYITYTYVWTVLR